MMMDSRQPLAVLVELPVFVLKLKFPPERTTMLFLCADSSMLWLRFTSDGEKRVVNDTIRAKFGLMGLNLSATAGSVILSKVSVIKPVVPPAVHRNHPSDLSSIVTAVPPGSVRKTLKNIPAPLRMFAALIVTAFPIAYPPYSI